MMGRNLGKRIPRKLSTIDVYERLVENSNSAGE